MEVAADDGTHYRFQATSPERRADAVEARTERTHGRQGALRDGVVAFRRGGPGVLDAVALAADREDEVRCAQLGAQTLDYATDSGGAGRAVLAAGGSEEVRDADDAAVGAEQHNEDAALLLAKTDDSITLHRPAVRGVNDEVRKLDGFVRYVQLERALHRSRLGVEAADGRPPGG